MAQRRAKKRWRPAKAQAALPPSPAVDIAANDDTPASAIVERLMALFPPAAVGESLAKRAATTELQRSARRLDRNKPPERGRVEPTPEQLRRGTIATVKTKDPDQASSIELPRNAAAPIDRWKARGQLTPRQFVACDRYRSDYARGGHERRVTMNWGGGGGSGDGTASMTGYLAANNAQLDARRRLADAREAVPDRMASAFDAVVLYEVAADVVGADAGEKGEMRAKLAIWTVRHCADILGDFYRLPA